MGFAFAAVGLCHGNSLEHALRPKTRQSFNTKAKVACNLSGIEPERCASPFLFDRVKKPWRCTLERNYGLAVQWLLGYHWDWPQCMPSARRSALRPRLWATTPDELEAALRGRSLRQRGEMARRHPRDGAQQAKSWSEATIYTRLDAEYWPSWLAAVPYRNDTAEGPRGLPPFRIGMIRQKTESRRRSVSE